MIREEIDFLKIKRGVELIMKPGTVHELRVPKARREKTISGYFDDPAQLATCAAELDASGKYAGIYITLNPCNPALLARCCNRVEAYTETTTTDPDIIVRRSWLLLDFDPKRPSGVSSTDRGSTREQSQLLAEHGTICVARNLATRLSPIPAYGAHLLIVSIVPMIRPQPILLNACSPGLPPAARPTTLTSMCRSSTLRESLRFTGQPERRFDTRSSASSVGHSRSSERMEVLRLEAAI